MDLEILDCLIGLAALGSTNPDGKPVCEVVATDDPDEIRIRGGFTVPADVAASWSPLYCTAPEQADRPGTAAPVGGVISMDRLPPGYTFKAATKD